MRREVDQQCVGVMYPQYPCVNTANYLNWTMKYSSAILVFNKVHTFKQAYVYHCRATIYS